MSTLKLIKLPNLSPSYGRIGHINFTVISVSTTCTCSPLSPEQIRVLEVSRTDGVLAIALLAADFDTAPDYITISYCWEGQTPDQEITCNGLGFRVTQNVAAVLSYMATSYHGKYLWIDAVCIDQDNVPEKNVQVQLMGQIYERALRTIAWVGRGDEDIYSAIQDLPNMLRKARNHIGNPMGRNKAHWAAHGVPTKLPSVWFSLYKLLLLPWFRRLWIIQEVVLSKDVSLVCGETVIDASFLLPLIEKHATFTIACMQEVVLPTRKFWKGLRCFNRICTLRKQRQAGMFQPHGLPELIPAVMDFLASDPRDRVYGVLGITNHFWQTILPITYEISVAKLYIQIATLWLGRRPNLLVLNQASSHPPMNGLPSWCPNFNQNSIPQRLGICYTTAGYSAGTTQGKGGWASAEHPQSSDAKHDAPSHLAGPVLESQNHRLPLIGFQIGYIERVVPPGWLLSSQELSEYDNPTLSLKWDQECLKISQSVYNQANSIPPAHARTLIANKDSTHHKYNGDIIKAYEETMSKFRNSNLWDDSGISAIATDYGASIEFGCFGRSFFSTSIGSIGVGPGRTKPGDIVCIFHDCVTPFIVRQTKDSSDIFEFLGETYVDGIMYGEALEMEEAKETRIFTLV